MAVRPTSPMMVQDVFGCQRAPRRACRGYANYLHTVLALGCLGQFFAATVSVYKRGAPPVAEGLASVLFTDESSIVGSGCMSRIGRLLGARHASHHTWHRMHHQTWQHMQQPSLVHCRLTHLVAGLWHSLGVAARACLSVAEAGEGSPCNHRAAPLRLSGPLSERGRLRHRRLRLRRQRKLGWKC